MSGTDTAFNCVLASVRIWKKVFNKSSAPKLPTSAASRKPSGAFDRRTRPADSGAEATPKTSISSPINLRRLSEDSPLGDAVAADPASFINPRPSPRIPEDSTMMSGGLAAEKDDNIRGSRRDRKSGSPRKRRSPISKPSASASTPTSARTSARTSAPVSAPTSIPTPVQIPTSSNQASATTAAMTAKRKPGRNPGVRPESTVETATRMPTVRVTRTHQDEAQFEGTFYESTTPELTHLDVSSAGYPFESGTDSPPTLSATSGPLGDVPMLTPQSITPRSSTLSVR